jgi:hypothetical protein
MAKILQIGAALIAASILVPVRGWSQQESPSTSTQGPSYPENSEASENTLSNQPPIPAAQSLGFVRALNSARLLVGENGPLQWGLISVRSMSFQEYVNQIHFDNPNIQPQSRNETASQLSTSIVVNRSFKRSHLVLQYNPSLFFINGHVYSNAMNQDLSLDVNFPLTQRWNLTVADRFSYYGSQRIFSQLSLDADYVTGSTLQKNFLDGPGSLLYNQVSAGFSYLWTPRTTLTVSPFFGYQHSTASVTSGQSGQDLSAFYEGGTVGVSHRLSPTRTLGFTYSMQAAVFSNTFVGSSTNPGSTQFLQDILVIYNQQLNATWHLSLGAGLVTNTGTGSSGTGLAMQAGVTKTFQRVEFAAWYNRGHQFNGFITNEVSDRVDGTAKIYLTRRLATATSGAYFRTAAGSPLSQSGLYATQQLSYQLTRHLSVFGSASHIKQIGNGVFVLSANRNYFTTGILWEPERTPRR